MTRSPLWGNASAKDAAFAFAVFAAKLGASIAIVGLAGFRQISDDDYARTVIAQSFAYSPHLDPSGTSWLPLPFWIGGGAMAIFGRSLDVARAVGYASSALAAAGFFGALRYAGLPRALCAASALFVSLGAWNLWTGAAPVPEGFTGALVAIGALSLVREEERAIPAWGAIALIAAALSRYETWAACAAFSAIALLRARHAREPRAFAMALLPLAAPLAWIAWNAHAHGDAFHFLARVSRYRHALGAAGAPLGEKLALYPKALVLGFPDVIVASIGAFFAVKRSAHRIGPLAIVAAAVLAFLVVGELGEGAPTHHPERALIPIVWLLVALSAFGFNPAIRDRKTMTSRIVLAAGAAAALVVVLRVPYALTRFPGQGEADRRAQIERGLALRAEGAKAIDIEPCAYEHFALVAAFGAPERTAIATPAERRPVTETCPKVALRR